MSVSSGFFNSLNGDRKYNAAQMSAIFDGLIIDGVFASIGTAFAVKAAGGLTVNVGIGKAWFDHTWTVNDSILPMTAPEAEVLLDRIDAVVLEVNGMESVRENTIKFVKGNPSSAPSRPTLTNEEMSISTLSVIFTENTALRSLTKLTLPLWSAQSLRRL